VPVDTEQLLKDKRIVALKAWFIAPDFTLDRYEWNGGDLPDFPEDGFLMARTRFVDGMGETVGGNGWIVVQETPAGLIFQATGEHGKPDPFRYPNAKFIKDKLCPSALLHVADAEAAQWR
jgi:hypothetical protein